MRTTTSSKLTASATVAGSTLFLTFSANGALIFQDFSDVTLEVGGTTQAFLDFETMTISTIANADSDYTLGIFANFITSPDLAIINGSFDGSFAYAILGNNRFALNLTVGDVIGGLNGSNLGNGGEFGSGSTGSSGATIAGGEILRTSTLAPGNNFAEGDSGFLGLVRYTLDQGAIVETHYGFLEIEVGSLTIKSGGWETTSDPAAGVTVVPEASSMALLALGLGGMMGYRRREAVAR